MKSLSLVPLLTAMIAFPAFGQAGNPTLKDTYHAIEVAEFDVQLGVSFPADRLASLQEEIVKQLRESKKTGEVIRAGDKVDHPDAPLLRLRGTLLKFKPGNQAERHFIGFGAGSTEVYAHISLTDATTGRVFVTEEIRGIVAAGYDLSTQADRLLAKRVVTATQLMLDKELPKPGDDSSSSAEGPPLPAEQYSLQLDSANLKMGVEQMNAEAVTGYRVVGAQVTGKKTAVLNFKKAAGS